MSRKRSLLFTAVVAATLTIATGLPAGAQPPTEGFLLSQTDAAYAEWPVSLTGCTTGNLFVGFVDADRLQQPLGSRPRTDHADVQAILTCQGGPVLEKTVQATDCGPAQIVELDSASVVCTFEIDNGGPTAEVAINLQWEADGDTFTETVQNPGMRAAHRTRLANLCGGVTITGTGGGLSGSQSLDNSNKLADATRITHYQEIQIGSP